MTKKPETMMRDDLVTCPETVTEEDTRSLVDSAGKVLLVLRCTRFDPPEAMDCDTRCIDGLCRHIR
jgi:hypothetical protein